MTENTPTFEAAVAALYSAPHDEFVAQRKRLAGELKASGDKAGAARLAKLARPPLSAWAVNQLWWQARAEFEALFASAERMRRGELEATSDHRDRLLRLRERAGGLLGAAGHAANDAVLRRVASTLAALAATGGFAPEAPGALGADRDPPGFEALTPQALAAAPAHSKRTESEERAAGDELERENEQRRALEAEAERELAERAERRAADERARKAEQLELEAALRTARIELETRRLEFVRARDAAASAERRLADARAAAAELETRLAALAATSQDER